MLAIGFATCMGMDEIQGYLTYEETHPLGLYRRPTPRVLGGSYGAGCFLVGEVPL